MARPAHLDPVHRHLTEAVIALAKSLGSVEPADFPKLLKIVEAIAIAQRLLLELGRDRTGE